MANQFNISKFLEEYQRYSCLWDKSIEEYKCRVKRDRCVFFLNFMFNLWNSINFNSFLLYNTIIVLYYTLDNEMSNIFSESYKKLLRSSLVNSLINELDTSNIFLRIIGFINQMGVFFMKIF